MAINWRAGLDEIEKSGQVAGQGFAQLAQVQQQRGAVMSGLIQEKRRIIEQNQATKRQENQQIFDAAIQAGNMFANVKRQADEAGREERRLKMTEEQHALQKAEFEQKQTANRAASKAIVQENAAKWNMTKPKEGYIQVPEGIGGEEAQANYIMTQKKMMLEEENAIAARESRDLNKKNIESTIASREAGDVLEKKKLKVQEEQLAETRRANALIEQAEKTQEAEKGSQSVVAKLNEEKEKVTQKNYVYNRYDEPTKKAQEKSYQGASTVVAALDNKREVLQNFTREVGVTPSNPDGTFSKNDFKIAAQKINDLPKNDPRRFKLAMMYGQLLFGAKQPGMGVISEAEYVLMDKMSGAGSFKELTALPEYSTNMVQLAEKLINKLGADAQREGGLAALGETLQEAEVNLRNELGEKISLSGGLFGKSKEERDELLYKALPKEQRQQISAAQFASMGMDKQMTLIYGDNAKKYNIQQALTNDYLNNHPEEILKVRTEEALAWTPSSTLPAATRQRLITQHQTLVNGVVDKARIANKPAESGFVDLPTDAGKYAKEALPDGSSRPMVNNQGLPIPSWNPLTGGEDYAAGMSRAPSTGYLGVAGNGGAPARPRPVVKTSSLK